MPSKLPPDAPSGSASSTPDEPAGIQPSGLVARFRQRLFQPRSPRETPPEASLPAPLTKRQAGLQSSIAEFLLVNRLRVRRSAASSADVMARASRIVFVTCQNWFGKAGKSDSRNADPQQPSQQTRR